MPLQGFKREEMAVVNRRVNLNGHLFDVHINNARAAVTVCGEIAARDDMWAEINEIKKHFEMTNPDYYDIIYKFKYVGNE